MVSVVSGRSKSILKIKNGLLSLNMQCLSILMCKTEVQNALYCI